MSTMYAMSDHHELTEAEAQEVSEFAEFLLVMGVVTPITNADPEDPHYGHLGLSLVDEEGQPTGQVVLVVDPETGDTETGLDYLMTQMEA